MIDGTAAPETDLHMGQTQVNEKDISVTTPHEGYEQVDEIKPPQFTENTIPTQVYEQTPDPDQNMMRMLAMREDERKMVEANAALEEAKARVPQVEGTINTVANSGENLDRDISISDNEPIKKTWDWSDFDFRKFMNNLAVKMKIDKIAALPGKIFKAVKNAAVKFWDVSAPKVTPPTQTSTPTTA